MGQTFKASIMSSYAVRLSVRSILKLLSRANGTTWTCPAFRPLLSLSDMPKMSDWSQIVFPKTERAAGLHVMRWPSLGFRV